MSRGLLLATAGQLPPSDHETPRLVRELRTLGIDAAIEPWSAPEVEWGAAAAVVVRSTWDYTAHLDAFLAWADGVSAHTSLWNPARVLRWNAHKGYLRELANEGVPVVPTVVIERGSTTEAIADALGATSAEVVVKPAVDAGGRGALRGEALAAGTIEHAAVLARSGDLLVQPYVASVADEGEYSVVVLGGDPLLARQKVPATGEFRVHEHHGGRTVACPLTGELLAITDVALRAVPQPVLYARVDIVRIGGSLHLMELELIEPFLYLDTDAEFAVAARAIAEVLEA